MLLFAFNDDGGGGGTPSQANNGIKDPGEGGLWTLPAPGTIVVTIPGGDMPILLPL